MAMPANDPAPEEKTEERWTVIQVAMFLSIAYQGARDLMLEGEFGKPEYDPALRRLTVQADKVRKRKKFIVRPIKRGPREHRYKKHK